MHDIVHVVAMSIASDKLMFNIQDVTNLKEMLEEKLSKDSTAISLPFKDVSVLPERLVYPKLNLLILSMKYVSLQIPDPFFEGMTELKVSHLQHFHMLSMPSSLCGLKKPSNFIFSQMSVRRYSNYWRAKEIGNSLHYRL
ncbi:hypothetical protein Dsin_024463 [Dipteronia sinensis]|uniref:Uncharacterized protein n=1 Tax=Dipteronia sinensis TaxID=43782 RepID=A0AAD9ZVI7_9ROSI|nr:hypothetical protein Dsin_024463 [Dipteronia sinensis]